MRSSLPSSAAWLENYSKSVVKRCYLFSYLMSDLASLFKFSWFLCLVVLTMGIVPGRGCHDSQRHPFSAPLEGGILFAECSAKGLYFRQKISTQHQLNASGLEQHHVTHWWRFVKVPEQKRRNLESDVSESSFSFFPSLVFSLLRKWRTTQTFLFSKSI